MRADAAANRESLMTAARHLVAAQGADVALSAIADEAGVGIATLYRHFPTREDLLIEIAVDARDRVVAIVEAHAPTIDADPEKGWSATVRALAALRPGALIPEIVGVLGSDAAESRVVRLREEIFAAFGDALDRAQRGGVVRADVTPVLFALGLSSITRPFPLPGHAKPLDHADWLTEVYLRGLRP